MNSEIREYVVSELLSGRAVEDNEDLLLSGLVDSIGVMRLVAFIEQHCNISVPPQDVTIDNFANLAVICSYIAERERA